MSSLSQSSSSVWVEANQFRILTKHFFLRLFRNDLVDFEDQMKERLIGILTILMIFSGLIAYLLLCRYLYTPDTGESWIEKMIIITFFMLVMGVVSILEWDIIYLDNRDLANLSPLPIKPRTLLMAKYISLLLFVSLFALSLNLFSSVFFIILLPQWRSSSPLFFIGHAGAHYLVMFLACFSGFFIYVFLLGFLQALLGPRLFTKTSSYLRSILLIIQVFLILAFFRILVYGPENVMPAKKLSAGVAGLGRFFDYFPPFWFTDLYETILGRPRLPFHGLYARALIALGIMIAGFVLTMSLSWGRVLWASVPERKSRFRKIARLPETLFNALFLRNPVERAIFHFFRKTLKTSVYHKMRLASFLACGTALVPFLITIRAVQEGPIFEVNLTMLSVALVLSFALLLGLRAVVNVPVSLEANWVLQMTERPNLRPYFSAISKAMITLYLIPLFGLLFGIYAVIWNPWTAFLHCLYGFSVSILIMQIFFLGFLKIPFACSYLPGKEKLQLYWFPYLLVFIAYLNIMSRIELKLLCSPLAFVYFYGAILIFVFGARAFRIFFLYRRNSIQYEEEPEPYVAGLDYQAPRHKRVE
jgi:hypothetical protein